MHIEDSPAKQRFRAEIPNLPSDLSTESVDGLFLAAGVISMQPLCESHRAKGVMTDDTQASTGHDLIADYLTRLDGSPGVYRMLDRESRVLYVGKAKSLKNRVASYARPQGHSPRISRMIGETASMMFVTTKTETEALLLEQNLIKQLKPK